MYITNRNYLQNITLVLQRVYVYLFLFFSNYTVIFQTRFFFFIEKKKKVYNLLIVCSGVLIIFLSSSPPLHVENIPAYYFMLGIRTTTLWIYFLNNLTLYLIWSQLTFFIYYIRVKALKQMKFWLRKMILITSRYRPILFFVRLCTLFTYWLLLCFRDTKSLMYETVWIDQWQFHCRLTPSIHQLLLPSFVFKCFVI